MNLEGLTLNIEQNFLLKNLLGARIDKVFQPGKLALALQVRSARENIFLYLNATNNAPHIRILQKNTINPENPPAFCMLMRKHLENGRITNISQEQLERIIVFDIDTIGTGSNIVTKKLIVELTGKNSNIILAQDDIIIDCIKHIGINNNKFRQMLPQKPYLSPPPQKGLNILTTSSAQIISEIEKIPLALTNALVKATLGIGPFTAKEIVFRSGLPCDINADNLDIQDLDALAEALESIVVPIKENDFTINVVLDENDKVIALTPYVPEHIRNTTCRQFADINQAIDFIVRYEQTAPPESMQLNKFIKNEILRTQKKLQMLEEEYNNATNAEQYKNIADNLMSHLHLLEKGMPSYAYVDFISGENKLAELIEQLTPIENVQRYYKLYNKAKRAVSWLDEQIKLSKEMYIYLSGIEFSLQNIQNKNELQEIKNELKAAGIIQEKTTKNIKVQQSLPVKITLPNGSLIFIGKNNKQNDLLTFKIARPNDIWLHAKDIPGSHVILQSTSKTAPQSELTTAASVAAWFSKARGSSNIPVDYTLRRHVKKPSGSKPGFVIYDNQKTLYVTPDENVLSNLLKQDN